MGPRFLRVVSAVVALVLSGTAAATVVCAATCLTQQQLTAGATAVPAATSAHAEHQAVVRAPSCHGDSSATVSAGDECCVRQPAVARVEAGVVTRPSMTGAVALEMTPAPGVLPARVDVPVTRSPAIDPPGPSRASFSVLRI